MGNYRESDSLFTYGVALKWYRFKLWLEGAPLVMKLRDQAGLPLAAFGKTNP